jgi:hypothetical protein
VGLIPLYATLVVERSVLDKLPNFKKRMDWFLRHRGDLVADHITVNSRSVLLSLVSPAQLPRLLGACAPAPHDLPADLTAAANCRWGCADC